MTPTDPPQAVAASALGPGPPASPITKRGDCPDSSPRPDRPPLPQGAGALRNPSELTRPAILAPMGGVQVAFMAQALRYIWCAASIGSAHGQVAHSAIT